MLDSSKIQSKLRLKGYDVKVDGDFGAKSYAALMAGVGGVPLVQMHLDLGEAAVIHFPEFDINTPRRLAHTLAQSSVETAGFTRLVESLNYSTSDLVSRFGRHRISIKDANTYGRKPGRVANQEMLANLLYGGDFGKDNLGNLIFGHGWKYRGRGTKQTTGLGNYEDLEKVTGMNVVDDPDQLADPNKGLLAGCVFWKVKGCNVFADSDDIERLTARVNGGKNGLADRTKALVRAKSFLF